MTRQEAAQFLHEEMKKHGLIGWSVRLNQNPDSRFLGLCSYKDKCIILSAHHIDIHPEPDIKNTIRHEIAHALVGPFNGHNDVWSDKAKEIGCDNTLPCSNLSLSPDIINAIRSGADVEVTFDEHVIRTPRYNVTRLQDKCEKCGKIAKQVSEKIVEMPEGMPDIKFIKLECGHTTSRNLPKGTPFHLFQMGGDPDCKHEWDKNNCVLCNRKRPYQFQIEGMRFLEAALAVNNGGACFDEMGLGKTIQAGGVIKYHPELSPTLWIVKSGTKYQFSHFLIWWLDEVPQIINGSKDPLYKNFKHYIIGYDMLVPKVKTMKKSGKIVTSGFPIEKFDEVGIKCVVLDECQQIKNVDSSRTQMVRRVVKSQNRKVIPLSGTPWNNRGSELFPVLNMLAPTKFWNEQKFKDEWVDYWYQGQYKKEGGINNPKKFREHIKDLAIRRERTEVMPELPLVNRTKLNVIMDPTQEKVYDEAVDEFVKWYEEQAEEISGMMIIAAMQKMRHLVAIAKMPATIEYVDEFVEDHPDKKLVVFAHHKDVQEMFFDKMKEKYSSKAFVEEYGYSIPVVQIKAEMNAYERNEAQNTFNENTRIIMVASQLAAGEALNLQTCCDCVMHERQWNPGKEEQCEGRFIRIGSTATSVSAVYAHLEGLTAIDSQLDAIVERKRIQFHNVHNNTEMQRWNEDSIMKDLAESIVNAHRAKKGRKKAS